MPFQFEAILDDFTKKHVHHIDVYNCSNFDAGLFTDGQEFEKGIGDSFCDEKVVLSWSYGGDVSGYISKLGYCRVTFL